MNLTDTSLLTPGCVLEQGALGRAPETPARSPEWIRLARRSLPVDRGGGVGAGVTVRWPHVNRTLTSFDTPGSSMVTP